MTHTERTGGWSVKFISYPGLSIVLADDVQKEDAIQIVKKRLRQARKAGKPVSRIDKRKWEIQTPDDAFLISDQEGILIAYPTTRRYRCILGRKVYLS